MDRRISVVLLLGAALCGCEATLPPEAQPKPYSVTYAKSTLVSLKPSWILVNPNSVRNARIGKFEARLMGQSSVCVAYDQQDRTGNYTGVKSYIVYISPNHADIVQVLPADSSHPCDPNELQPFPELNGPSAAPAPKPAPAAKHPGHGPKLK